MSSSIAFEVAGVDNGDLDIRAHAAPLRVGLNIDAHQQPFEHLILLRERMTVQEEGAEHFHVATCIVAGRMRELPVGDVDETAGEIIETYTLQSANEQSKAAG